MTNARLLEEPEGLRNSIRPALRNSIGGATPRSPAALATPTNSHRFGRAIAWRARVDVFANDSMATGMITQLVAPNTMPFKTPAQAARSRERTLAIVARETVDRLRSREKTRIELGKTSAQVPPRDTTSGDSSQR